MFMHTVITVFPFPSNNIVYIKNKQSGKGVLILYHTGLELSVVFQIRN